MITTAITLFGLIALFAVLTFSSFVSVIIGNNRIYKKSKKLWTISLVICLASICLLSVTVIYTGKKAVNRTYITTQTLSEKGKVSVVNFVKPDIITFKQSTGFEWPKNAKIITSGHENYLFDWEFYLVFETDRDVLETWLSSPPPWGVEEWVRGPIPLEIPTIDFTQIEFG